MMTIDATSSSKKNSSYLTLLKTSNKPGSEFGNKNSFAKNSECSEENSPPQAKLFWGFVKCFSEYAKRIYETCDHNFFNLAIIIVQFILFPRFGSNN